jgi:hypothetical protein
MKKLVSVADILEREFGPTIKEWLRRVNLVPELTKVSLSDADRTSHLPKLFDDLIRRLRLANNAHPSDTQTAATHGEIRYEQGYSTPMLVDESRLLQVATFGTLQLHQSELDPGQLLLDVMVIADEVDFQLGRAVCDLETKRARSAA